MDAISLVSDRTCPDSGINNFSGTSGNSSVLLDNVTTTAETTSTVPGIDHGNDLRDVQCDIIQDENEKVRISKRISADSGSAFEFVDIPLSEEESSPCYQAELFHRKVCPPSELDLSKRHSNHQTKTCEMDLLEERDTFSPVSTGYSSDHQPEDACSSLDFIPDVGTLNGDNKSFDKKKGKSTSTKEEKQRQNEEIVIMETSSISSETGSWESVFPHRTNMEVKDCCRNFLHNERRSSAQCAGGGSRILGDYLDRSDIVTHPSSSSVTACFIDASTLLDESEVAYPTIAPKLPEGGCFGPKPESIKKDHPEHNSDRSEDSDKDAWPKGVHLDNLETFHKSFEMCKVKMAACKGSNSSNSTSTSSDGSPLKDGESASNLSDEEKLWKRENSKQSLNGRVEIKDQYTKQSPNGYKNIFSTSADADADALLTRQGTFDMDENETVQLRKDQERKQGSLVFQNSIQQFSGHLISPKMPFPENEFTEYSPSPSNSSWVDQDKRKGYYQGLDDSNDGPTTPSSRKSRTQSESEAPAPCVLPDTPHNSIVQLDLSLKSNSKDTSYSGESENSVGIKIPKRSLRCESAPIVSGGASIKDFTPKQCESPPVRRKTETCPIVSGGFHSLDFLSENEGTSQSRERSRMTQSVTSWVVDMSDCKTRRRRSTSSSSSTDNTARSADVSSDRGGSGSSHKNGLGFYVSLNDMEPPRAIDSDSSSSQKLSRSLHESIKKPTGFYVDLSESENSRNATPPPTTNSQTPPVNGNDKKNIFSMFIDFGEKKPVPKREPLSLASRLSNSLHQKRDGSDLMKTSSSSTETLMSRSTHKPSAERLDSAGETMVGSSDESRKHSLLPENEPIVIRRTQHRNLQRDESKRHSWNPQESTSAQNARKEHKRSASLTGDKGIMNILDKIPLISKTSSMSIDSSLSPFDDFTCSKSELSTYSNNSHSGTSASIHSSYGEREMSKKMKKRRRDVQINETFDKSSQGSLTDGVFSKDLSPASTTDTEDLTFQQEDNYTSAPESGSNKENGRPLIMETIIETKEVSSPKKDVSKASKPATINGDIKSSAHTMETLHATIEKQKQLLETVNEHVVETSSNFVKLSDMDKPFTKFELHSPDTMSKSVGNHRHISRLFQETRSRPHSWAMTRSTGNTILNITSSVENLRSLTRLFPHLSKEFSNSLPGDFSIDFNNRSPNEMDYLQSDFSADSSLASSISRSGMDESSISCRQPRRLGEDLLKMFLQEIATDVVVEVNGRRIKAHKCILKSRCQFFAAMLAGGWVQSAGNVISLPGYSYSAVHFALCHIYSGASHPPEGISLMELAALADYLGLEGLKEVTAHALKMNYCHNFHKPCSGCIDGILQVLPVALNHALDDLYRKCLKWTCRHYLKVWPTRSFAQLPSDILGRCRQQIVAHLTSESVLETILDCDDIVAQIAPCRWAASIENIVRDVMDAAYGYVSDHFASLIASDSFLSLGHDKSSNISRLESVLLRTASSLTPDQACRSYQRVTRLNAVLAAKVIKVPNIGEHAREFGEGVHEEEMEWNEEFIRLVSAIVSAVEQCLTRQCARAMRVTAWQRMDLELRKKIQKLACLTEPLDLRRGKPVTKALSFNTGSRNQDLYQVKLAIQAHSKRALAQDTQLYRATTHTQTNDRNIQTIEKGVQANNETKESTVKLFKSSSKAHVPIIQPPVVTRIKVEKPNILSHRRTQSEDSSSSLKFSEATVTQKNVSVGNIRLAEIRPRYLEPRKPRGPLKSQTSSNIPATLKGKAISSSDSSRTSSPATSSKRISSAGPRKFGPKSINMSLDSLASPSKKIDQKKGRVENEISIDSLADSMKSSLKTEKTISQESLAKITRSNPIINKENKAVKQNVAKIAKNKSLSCQNTSGSSPSSVTNKSSRLSSTNSSVNSPRDAFKHRSISVPAGPITVVRKSFLSAKSREILARKSALAQQSAPVKQQEKIVPVNKSASSTNIPMRKPVPPTTLHLRKTAKVPQNAVLSPVKSVPAKSASSAKTTKIALHKGEKSTKHRTADNRRDNNEIELVIQSPKDGRIESKLERSSTFCKEAPDLPVSELQIID